MLILNEMIHSARIVALNGRPHAPAHIRSLTGDSIGHWEGDTLVVDTTNFSQEAGFRGASKDLHLVERFTPRRREHAEVRVHGRRSRDVDGEVERVDPDDEDRRADLRVRVPREQLRDGGRAERRALRGSAES